MALAGLLFGSGTRKKEVLLRIVILSIIYVLAFSTRLFSVLRYESVIHEFDPYFNFRSTKYLIERGWYDFYNWFDDFSWYPLGRIVGGTVYPGIQITAAVMYWLLRALNFTVDIRNVCVLTSPFFASNTAMTAYAFGNEVKGPSAGLLAAAFIAIVPGYISRSVAGSFDNEGVAIFALITTFWLFVRSVKTGSLFWSLMTCLLYFYMVNAWGGYIFILNLIGVYALILMVMGRFTHKLYVAYSTFYVIGTLLSMNVRFVSFQAVQTGEHMGALGVFGLMQVYTFVNWMRSHIEPRLFSRLFGLVVTGVVVAGLSAFVVGTATGYISPWTGRFYSMLDPTYAKKYIPIIASVSEHQPTTWASYIFDLHILMLLLPVGLFYCFRDINDASIFLIVYGLFSVYFSSVMVRLMLVLAPIACLLSAIGVSNLIKIYMRIISSRGSAAGSDASAGAAGSSAAAAAAAQDETKSTRAPKSVAFALVGGIAAMFIMYVYHCTWVTSEAYSSPSIVLAARGYGGQRIIFDDFREAYFWLSQNTPDDAKICSWWDYGYQITAMANRTVLVDNNTWNYTHIATVGRIMASPEDESWKMMKQLDSDYALVIFGGVTGYASDDINKFLWMVRIGGSVYPSIREEQYLSPRGEYRIDAGGSQTMLQSLMYKASYYRFGEMMTEQGRPTGFDRVRRVEIGNKNFDLKYFDEAYSSEHFLVRIFKRKAEPNRGTFY